jgi:hypothetical protein
LENNMTAVADKVHSILSPSGAKRWSKCTAALAACKDLPVRQRDTRAADLGSAKHQSVEWILSNPTEHLSAQKAQELAFYNNTQFTVDAEYTDHVNAAVAHARALGGDQMYERHVSTEPLFGIPGQGGTIDLVALHAFDGYIDLLDFKFGFTPVAPDGPQNKIYAAAILAEIDPDRLIYTKARLHIFQPKQSDQLKTIEITRDELDAYIASIREAAQEAHRLYTNKEVIPAEALETWKTPGDEQCEWCDIRLVCQARLAQLSADFPIMPAPPIGDRPITYDPVQMTAAELDNALTRVDSVVKFIQDWAANIRAEGTRRAQLGELPGWMVADGKKGARQVPEADRPLFESIVTTDLGDDAYEPRKVKSPTQLELAYKRLKRLSEWRDLQDGPADAEGVRRGGFIVQAAGAPSLARTTEGLAAQGSNLAAEFGLVEAS